MSFEKNIVELNFLFLIKLSSQKRILTRIKLPLIRKT